MARETGKRGGRTSNRKGSISKRGAALTGSAGSSLPSFFPLELLPLSQRFLPSAEEMRALDEAAIALGESSLGLMNRAGEAIAHWIAFSIGTADLKALPFSPKRKKSVEALVSLVCGPGNNGGDGLVAARTLRRMRAIKSQVFVVPAERYSADFLVQLQRLVSARCTVFLVAERDEVDSGLLPPSVAKLRRVGWREFGQELNHSAVTVDALLGTGQRAAPAGAVERAVYALNASRDSGAKLLSVDIPTGVDASEGQVFEPAVKAHATLAIECVKRGMLQYPARAMCGVLSIAPIGILEKALRHVPPPSLRVLLPGDPLLAQSKRGPDAHKGNFRRIFVVGGSRSMPGAPLLAAHAALRTGAPLVTVPFISGSPPVGAPPEVMRILVDDEPGMAWEAPLAEWISRGPAVLVVGPGLGIGSHVTRLVERVIAISCSSRIPLVLDADGLTALAELLASGKKFSLPQAVLTPHPGEMARLIGAIINSEGTSAREVQQTRFKAAALVASALSTTVILKGASSLIASGASPGLVVGSEASLAVLMNLSGTPWMATGGSGDVLSGVVAGFLSQNMPPLHAAAAGTYYHGVAGELAAFSGARENWQGAPTVGGHPILASDIVSQLPYAFSVGASSIVNQKGF